jgi:NhaP-type Na+/H+ or K+/H+ antiporter
MIAVALRRIAVVVGLAGLGWAFAAAFGVSPVAPQREYLIAVTALLAIGLYSSTYGIATDSARLDVRLVVLAVTIGVILKALIIAAVMYAVFRDPAYVILAVAVAQIDPLAVAALDRQAGMSDRARTILAAWASFDDPVTTLLTIYAGAVLLDMRGAPPASYSGSGANLLDLGTDTAQNLALAAAAFVVWRLIRIGARRARRLPDPRRQRLLRVGTAAAVLALLAIAAVAVAEFLMLGLALTGLFFRPRIAAAVRWLTSVAFLVAIVVLGVVLSGGVDLVGGLVLGLAAYGAQIVVGLLLTIGLPRSDRLALALGQQNGITAIILALLLEPDFPGTVGVVGPAILVVAVAHVVANGIRTRNRPGALTLDTAPAAPDPAGSKPAADLPDLDERGRAHRATSIA